MRELPPNFIEVVPGEWTPLPDGWREVGGERPRYVERVMGFGAVEEVAVALRELAAWLEEHHEVQLRNLYINSQEDETIMEVLRAGRQQLGHLYERAATMSEHTPTRGDKMLLGLFVAGIDALGRSGVDEVELAHEEDPIRWWCGGNWQGRRVFSERFPYPAHAVEDLVARTMNGGLCTKCERTTVVGVIIDGFCSRTLTATDVDEPESYRYVRSCEQQVVQEGEVPPWMEQVGEPHERLATPQEVDEGCELGVAFDTLYRVRPQAT